MASLLKMAIQEVLFHSVLYEAVICATLFQLSLLFELYTGHSEKVRQPFNWSFCAQILPQSSYFRAERPPQIDSPTPTASTRM